MPLPSPHLCWTLEKMSVINPYFQPFFYLGNMCAAARPLPRTEHLDQGTEAPGCLAQDIGSLVQGIGLGWDTGLGLARLGPSMLRKLGPP